MARNRGNWDVNYPDVIRYLEANEIPYEEFSDGQHLRIYGAVSQIDLWPSRMTYHVIKSERPVRADEYPRLGFYFDEKKLDTLLNE